MERSELERKKLEIEKMLQEYYVLKEASQCRSESRVSAKESNCHGSAVKKKDIYLRTSNVEMSARRSEDVDSQLQLLN